MQKHLIRRIYYLNWEQKMTARIKLSTRLMRVYKWMCKNGREFIKSVKEKKSKLIAELFKHEPLFFGVASFQYFYVVLFSLLVIRSVDLKAMDSHSHWTQKKFALMKSH